MLFCDITKKHILTIKYRKGTLDYLESECDHTVIDIKCSRLNKF